MNRTRWRTIGIWVLAFGVLAFAASGDAVAGKKKKKDKQKGEDPYAEYVWPPPPDPARIKLDSVIHGRADVEASGKWQRTLLGASPKSPYDSLVKPHGVELDSKRRVLVTDPGTAALIRFDREAGKMDVFGTKGAVQLRLPLGLDVGPDDTAYVADAGLRQVVAFDPEGKTVAVFGRKGDLTNPTDAVLAPDAKRLFVADSKAHKVFIFDVATGNAVSSFGERGDGEGQFAFPTSLAFGPEGNLFVVDQINARVQVFDGEGEFVDQFGSRGLGFASFVRPKDVAVDEVGFIFVTDNAFNNVQLFDADFTLLTYIGQGGGGPGRFNGISGIAVLGDEIAVVDQLGRRVQIFRFVVPKDQ